MVVGAAVCQDAVVRLLIVGVMVVAFTACSADDAVSPGTASGSSTMVTADAPVTTAGPSTTTTRSATTTATARPTPTTERSTSTTGPALYADHVSQQYADTANWICHPDLATDECRDLATTVIDADGSTTRRPHGPCHEPGGRLFLRVSDNVG